MQIVLIKQTDQQLEEPQASAVRSFLFDFFKGATETDHRAWMRFMRSMNEAVAGEYFSFKIERQRVGVAHRKQMALETKIFNSQERIADVKQFRAWSYIGCGWCDWMAGSKGGVVPVPKSISFSQCSEEEAEQFRESFLAFMRTEHAQHYLFPHLSAQLAEQCMEELLKPLERNHRET